jgi:hypothetical protein
VRNELIEAIKDARNSPVDLRNRLQSKDALMADSKGERLYGGGRGIRTLSRTLPGLVSRYSAMPQADTLFFPVRWKGFETTRQIER